MTADELVRAVDRLVDHIGQWTPSRWAASTASSGAGGATGGGTVSRAETVHALAQRLADLEASVTGRPDRPVPRLDNDLALPDQLRVTARDLLAADPSEPVLAAAVDAVADARRALS
jgi:hypothetical protein